ncbi:MAG: hypothetical protein ACI932_001844, partial [Paracoccaceae bacterium]
MVAKAYTVAFQGVDARLVEVQCAVTPGLPNFAIVYSINYLYTVSSKWRSDNTEKAVSLFLRANVYRSP